jgi:hypothetical protein
MDKKFKREIRKSLEYANEYGEPPEEDIIYKLTPERKLRLKEKLRAIDIRLGRIVEEPDKKTSKSSKEEKLYNKILSNPNISDIDKKHLKRNTKEGTKLDMDDLKAFEKNALMMNDDWSDEEKPKKKKAQKTGNIMKARSDLKKKDDKYEITTDMNVRKGLGPKAKKALKESVIKALDKEFKGGRIILDYSSDEEPIKRKRGRPKKGKGYGSFKSISM